MKTSGSGSKTGTERTVSLRFRGADSEFVRLIDELEQLPSDAAQELCRLLNYYSGTLVDHPKPRGQINI